MATAQPNHRRNRYTTVYMPRGAEPHPKPNPSFEACCSHLSMTRFFTNNQQLICSHCGQPPANGWLWRCTQDRELILEDDADRGVVQKIDALPDLFDKPPPGPRSVAVRQNYTSFLSEASDEHMKEYSPKQIEQVLEQRLKVLEIANRSKFGILNGIFFSAPVDDEVPDGDANHKSSSPTYKPWLPAVECQTKWCQNCRPHSAERGWLSLDGIADGDIPLTAIYGFGFDMFGKRPVALVKHVANLGLRPNPDNITNMRSTTQRERRPAWRGPLPLRTQNPRPNTNLGLGISDFPSSSSSTPKTPKPRINLLAIPDMPVRWVRVQAHLDRLYAAEDARNAAAAAASQNSNTNPLGLMCSTSLPSLITNAPLLETPLSPTNGSFPPDVPFPPSPIPGRRHSFTLLPRLSMVGNIPLPEQTDEEIESISGASSIMGDDDYQHEGCSGSGSSSAAISHMGVDEIVDLTTFYSPRPPITNTQYDGEILDLTSFYSPAPNTDTKEKNFLVSESEPISPITNMGEEETSASEGVGAFHKEPLVLKNGVAVLEESVEEHEADVVTQY